LNAVDWLPAQFASYMAEKVLHFNATPFCCSAPDSSDRDILSRFQANRRRFGAFAAPAV